MSKESYTRGFCKAAQAAGVDPKKLAWFAQKNQSVAIDAIRGTPRQGAMSRSSSSPWANAAGATIGMKDLFGKSSRKPGISDMVRSTSDPRVVEMMERFKNRPRYKPQPPIPMKTDGIPSIKNAEDGSSSIWGRVVSLIN